MDAFGGHAEQNPDVDSHANDNAAIVTAEAEVPAATEEFDDDMRQELANRSQNIARLMDGVVDQSLINQLEDEMTQFRSALRAIVHKVDALSKPKDPQQSYQLVSSAEAQEAEFHQKRLLYQKMIAIVLSEAGNEKLAKAWSTVENLLDQHEVMDNFIKLTENKEEFLKMMEGVQEHQETMQSLTQCYQQGDWTRLKAILVELIEQYDKQGYARRAAILIEAESSKDANQTNRSVTTFVGQGMNLMNHLIMPSVSELKKMAQTGDQKRLLREIKSATIEKLTNKIIRSFALEIAFISPFLMLIGLQYRQAALTDPTAECYGALANWLLTYFLAFGFFSVLRVIRVPVLRGLTHSLYFNYTLMITAIQIIFLTAWFFYGNAVFLASRNPQGQCDATASDPNVAEMRRFDPTVLMITMGVLLLVHWFIFIAIIQLLLFTLMLYSLWEGVVHATKKMQQGFSVASLIELLLEAMGEGELQDSVMIGGIQFLMNDDTFYCKRCSKPFDELEMQANEFEAGLEEGNGGFTQRDAHVNEQIVQLPCNPAHVFHRECIESFYFCPECFTPIENDIPESFMDERSERREDSDEENLLDDYNDAADVEMEFSAHEERKSYDGRVVSFRLP